VPDEPPAQRPPLVYAPWTDDQVASLVGFQRDARWHEFTCGRCRSTLNTRNDGWHCWRDDGYTQNWAHQFMTDWSWQLPSAWSSTHGPVPGVAYCATCEHAVDYHTNVGCTQRVDGARCDCREGWSTTGEPPRGTTPQ
jgi:hypothetical protein